MLHAFISMAGTTMSSLYSDTKDVEIIGITVKNKHINGLKIFFLIIFLYHKTYIIHSTGFLIADNGITCLFLCTNRSESLSGNKRRGFNHLCIHHKKV